MASPNKPTTQHDASNGYCGVERRRINLELYEKKTFGLPGCKQLQVDANFGLAHGQVDEDACRRMCAQVTDLNNRNNHGFLTLGEVSFPGYAFYPEVEDNVELVTQEQYISMAMGEEEIGMFRKHLHGFQQIGSQVLKMVGCSWKQVKGAHILLQVQQNTHFTWHNDDKDMKSVSLCLSRNLITVIVPLNDVDSGMQIWPFKEFQYKGIGCIVAFPGGAQHRSIISVHSNQTGSKGIFQRTSEEIRQGPIKLCMFLDKRYRRKRK